MDVGSREAHVVAVYRGALVARSYAGEGKEHRIRRTPMIGQGKTVRGAERCVGASGVSDASHACKPGRPFVGHAHARTEKEHTSENATCVQNELKIS